ncbi:enoyl-ACP reductase FabI [Desulfovibrio psychrotolerans]|uniref:Enoyl-[acyl-carrier-protein] reductase [NADH] n=1 Tax=Desulfovibrio psychrotolerans TaxID=415242 RepID=A0A7J0BU84_9BACT|nr:enoyl-ACP reductase [Desulfovibrio psychrotolerans]GFM36751.1 enoyl-[acyl-carrier-protein] reductase [NADH] [Desulfovibrio psychrotolerans]
MLLEGKRALIFGVANNKSIAYGIAKEFKAQGARLAFNFLGDALKKRVEPIAEELGGDFIFQCDVTSDEEIAAAVERVKQEWGGVDILIHSVGFANRDDLQGRYIDTSRDGYKLALDISAYSLTALCKAYEELLTDNASVITLTYYGAEKVITNYNVMGVAKAALEASVRYLAVDLGTRNVRINGISAGPIKTLAASGISGFRSILTYIEEQAPLRRNVTIEDVGRSAVYLASDLSSGVTGEILHVDSGYNVMGIGL